MRRRVGRPGLIGTAARTAVIAGTATAVSGKVASSQQAKAQQQAAAQQAAAQQAAAQQAAPPAGGDTIAELQKLADLKSAGLLSDEEFSAAKAKLLGI